jgi:hypothetical protein
MPEVHTTVRDPQMSCVCSDEEAIEVAAVDPFRRKTFYDTSMNQVGGSVSSEVWSCEEYNSAK